MSELLLDHDPTTGITEFFDYDDNTDLVTIRTEQDVTDLAEQNKALFNDVDNPHRFGGEWHRVAQIPSTVYNELYQSGKIHDKQYMRRFLNDPDNRVFRTRPGKI